MTKNKKQKAAVRSRMEATGTQYTKALRESAEAEPAWVGIIRNNPLETFPRRRDDPRFTLPDEYLEYVDDAKFHVIDAFGELSGWENQPNTEYIYGLDSLALSDAVHRTGLLGELKDARYSLLSRYGHLTLAEAQRAGSDFDDMKQTFLILSDLNTPDRLYEAAHTTGNDIQKELARRIMELIRTGRAAGIHVLVSDTSK